MLQNWPYHGLGRLGGIRQLSEKVTCLHPRDVGDTHPLEQSIRMHLRSTPLKKYQCSTESVERIRAFVTNGDGNPIVKARCAAVAVFVLLRERDKRDWAFVPSLRRTSRILRIPATSVDSDI